MQEYLEVHLLLLLFWCRNWGCKCIMQCHSLDKEDPSYFLILDSRNSCLNLREVWNWKRNKMIILFHQLKMTKQICNNHLSKKVWCNKKNNLILIIRQKVQIKIVKAIPINSNITISRAKKEFKIPLVMF